MLYTVAQENIQTVTRTLYIVIKIYETLTL